MIIVDNDSYLRTYNIFGIESKSHAISVPIHFTLFWAPSSAKTLYMYRRRVQNPNKSTILKKNLSLMNSHDRDSLCNFANHLHIINKFNKVIQYYFF